MKKVIIKNQFICIGKIDEIIAYLESIAKEYSTVKSFIQKSLQ